MIEIDGSQGEGGGQIIRTALAMSAATGQPFRAVNIRHGRDAPGLKAQHVAAIKALQKVCNATAIDATIGSEHLEFYPKQLKGSTINIDIGTAGSVALVLQSVLLPAFLASGRTKITITGGTDVPFSPPADYVQRILLPQLRKFADIDMKILRRGYMPGQGKIEIIIKPKEPQPFDLTTKGDLQQIRGISHASADLQTRNVAERQTDGAKNLLKKFNVPVMIETQYAQTESTGSGLLLYAYFAHENEVSHLNPVILGSSNLGKKLTPAEDIGRAAASQLMDEIQSTGCVDSHLADQLLPFLAWFGGQYRIADQSSHFKSNLATILQFKPNAVHVQANTVKSNL